MSLQNKVAIITGVTGGTGPAIVERFYDEKCKLVLSYHREDNLSALPVKILEDSKNVLTVKTEATNQSDVINLFNQSIEKFSTVSILANIIGGYMDTKPFTDLELEEWNSMIDRNLTACFLTSREALRRMKDNDYGRIIHLSAKSGIYPEAERGAYGVAKAAVAFLTRILGEEFKKSGITINAIAPSIIKTPANESWGKPDDMQHWVTPAQIADLMIFLCQASSKSINGSVIEISGGV